MTIFINDEISIWSKWNIFISVSRQFTWCKPKWNLLRVLFHCGHYDRWSFISGDKISCKHYPKWNHMRGNINACIYFIKTKMIGFYRMGRFSRTTLETKFHFISAAKKYIYIHITFFMVYSNFISARFHLDLM